MIDFALYAKYGEAIYRALIATDAPAPTAEVGAIYRAFVDDHGVLTRALGPAAGAADDHAHLFAFFFQLRRAFHHIFTSVLGNAGPSVRPRAEIWQSVFTHDMRRYRRTLYRRMQTIPTLITGPSGTGKELVARAIARSQYIPFSPVRRSFVAERAPLAAVNLSALSPTLIESELFGHRKGAFTGASADRAGWLESTPRHGAVFLDEMGEISPDIQVKLLRVLETRTFSRIGESKERRFEDKLIAATDRDLAEAMRRGIFREDLYYQLCADRIVTPSLAECLAGDDTELEVLVQYLARKEVGDSDAEALANESLAFIRRALPPGYARPGNVRELGQCVRNVMIRGAYTPEVNPGGRDEDLAVQLREGRLSAGELLRAYCTRVYALTGNYEETARRLSIDRRTVKSRIDPRLLARLREAPGGTPQ